MAAPLLPRTALLIVAILGIFLLNRASTQARDTIRKHHLEDVEQSLYFARSLHGTYPPYDQPTWCGQLQDPGSAPVLAEIEQALRAQNEKYANPAKPFPTDPLADHDYFYWKRSPAIFELYATLETTPTGERSVTACPGTLAGAYDYGLTSVWRENR